MIIKLYRIVCADRQQLQEGKKNLNLMSMSYVKNMDCQQVPTAISFTKRVSGPNRLQANDNKTYVIGVWVRCAPFGRMPLLIAIMHAQKYYIENAIL